MIIVEILIYFALSLFIYLSILSLSSLFPLSKAKAIPIILFIYLFIIGQVNKSPFQTYPFVSWTMYSQTYPDQSNFEYLIELNDQSVIHYPFEVITFTSQRAFMRKIRQTVQSAEDSHGDSELLKSTVSSLVNIYEDSNPNRTIHSFRINHVYISITDSNQRFSTSRSKMFEMTFDK